MKISKHPFFFVITTRYKVRVVRELLSLHRNGGKLLDVGCGSGFMLSQLGRDFAEASGIDMSAEAIAFGRRYSNAIFQVANAERLPFADRSFDCVISTDAFEHIPDDEAAILEIARVLKPGGITIIYVPSEMGLLSGTKCATLYHESDVGHLKDERYYTMESLRALARRAGLPVVAIGYHDIFFQEFFTQALKWLSFKLGKQYRNQSDIGVFIRSPWFPAYRWLILPLIDLLVCLEEWICEKIFRARIPGHRIVMKCRKVDV